MVVDINKFLISNLSVFRAKYSTGYQLLRTMEIVVIITIRRLPLQIRF